MDDVAQPIESDAQQAPSGSAHGGGPTDAPPTGGDTKAMIKALLKEYPTLDQLQAETLVWGYQTNNLGVLQEQ